MSSKKLVTSAQVESLRTMANAKGVPREIFQEWLDREASNILTSLKETAGFGKVICRHVTVNQDQLPHDAIKAVKHYHIINNDVVKTMPKVDGVEVDVLFFRVGRCVNNTELEKEYEKRDLIPTDPYTLAKVNEDDPTFAGEYTHGTHWKNTNGKWCSMACFYSHGFTSIKVDEDDHDRCGRPCVWDGSFWFAGVRKAS